MQKGYFAAAWGDVTQSPGWISKFVRLGLLCLIPIFGIIVMYGYLYAWARDIAWNVHRPLPDRIFGNEDGRLYSRGFFVLVVAFVFSLVPGLVGGLFSLSAGVTTLFWPGDYMSNALVFGLGSGFIIALLALVLTFAAYFFIWVGSMRVAIYGTLSSGFQVRKIWAMMRYDFMGLLRIFGMALLCDLVIAFIGGVIGFVLVLFASVIGFSATTLLDERGAIFFVILFCLIVVAFFLVIGMAAGVLVEALVARALGYWTRQFEVAQWGGQDDPMPFEQRFAAASAAQAQQAQAQQSQQASQQAYWAQPSPQPTQPQSCQATQPEQQWHQGYASPYGGSSNLEPPVMPERSEHHSEQNAAECMPESFEGAANHQQPPVIDVEPSHDIVDALSSVDRTSELQQMTASDEVNASADGSAQEVSVASSVEADTESSRSTEDKE